MRGRQNEAPFRSLLEKARRSIHLRREAQSEELADEPRYRLAQHEDAVSNLSHLFLRIARIRGMCRSGTTFPRGEQGQALSSLEMPGLDRACRLLDFPLKSAQQTPYCRDVAAKAA